MVVKNWKINPILEWNLISLKLMMNLIILQHQSFLNTPGQLFLMVHKPHMKERILPVKHKTVKISFRTC